MIGKWIVKKWFFTPKEAPENIDFTLSHTPIEVNKNAPTLRAYITIKNRNRTPVTIDRLFFNFNIHGVNVETVYLDKHIIGDKDERQISLVIPLNEIQIKRIPEQAEVERIHIDSRGYFESPYFDFEVHSKQKETQNFKIC